MKAEEKRAARERRRDRVRRRVRGTDERPRLSVYRSNRHIYAQVVSDESGKVLASASTLKLGGATSNCTAARAVGERIAQLCRERNIHRVVFDRNGFLYHGRVSAVAAAAREAGLEL